jgi:asparagine synthase (glutamine-hydrolysing)
MLLDGVGGDSVLSEGRRIARLMRAGRWRTAYREAAGHNRFWNGAFPPRRELLRSARPAYVPEVVLRPLRRRRERTRIEQRLRRSPIDEEFGRKMAARERLRVLEHHSAPGPLLDSRLERSRAISHPYVTVGRERYDRVASAVAVEPRDPFLDLRVLSFCVSLPDDQMLSDGWPKAILRRATAGLLADEVRWRCGKEHLGWAFTAAMIEKTGSASHHLTVEELPTRLSRYVDLDAARNLRRSQLGRGDAQKAADAYHVTALAEWLQRHERRPMSGEATEEDRG